MTAAAGPPVVIAGGGTGGHVFPGLTIAHALAARGWAVTFVGTAAGIETRAVPAAGFPLRLVPGRQLRGGGAGRVARGLGAAARGLVASLRLLGELRPRLVVGVGGYASVAMVLAGRLRRLPTLLLEQNAIPGAANRLLGRFAARICVGFEQTRRAFPPGRAVHTGNPVRPEIVAAATARPRAAERVGLLVFGGSQGAHRVNEAMVGAIGELGAEARRLDLVHQTGPSERDQVAAGYGRLGVAARVEEFITDMGAAYAAADLVVARAGAMSCTEIAVVGRPAILLPYPHAADDHQRRNAEILVRAGAAEMILEPELGAARLAATLRALLADDARRAAMGERARAIGRPDAAERIVAECQGLVDRWWSGVPLATPGNGRRDLKRS